MKVLPVHARTLARSLVEAGHQVQMVCLRDARTHTGLTGPSLMAGATALWMGSR